MDGKISVTSGSDAKLRFAFKDAAGAPLAVSSPKIILASRGIGDRVSLSLANDAVGVVDLIIEGSNPIPTGDYEVRVQVALADGATLATERVAINVR